MCNYRWSTVGVTAKSGNIGRVLAKHAFTSGFTTWVTTRARVIINKLVSLFVETRIFQKWKYFSLSIMLSMFREIWSNENVQESVFWYHVYYARKSYMRERQDAKQFIRTPLDFDDILI